MPVSESTLMSRLVVFLLDRQRYALELARVERVLPLLELARFPQAPEIVLGVFNLHGDLIPVVDIRRRFRLPAREPQIADHLVVVQTARRRLAFIVDTVEGVVNGDHAALPEEIAPGLEYLRGVVRLRDDIVFVHDVDAFLSLDEEARLDVALSSRDRS